ncbi:hypothetical protein HK096_000010 [Nowakowskiella sp. JEL0078]|nr:hypothetical protein HK096_000010 [Nowakowskiella sp. JEL0078]
MPDSFKQWLAGFIDGDGTFTIDRQNNAKKKLMVKSYYGKVHLQIIIFPIFDAFPLVTVKYFDYLLVKQAAEVLSSNLTRAEINSRLEELYSPAKDFKSIVWSGVDLQNITAAHKSILANYWLVGFWEAEAPGRFAHVIRLIFGAAAKVKDRRPLQDYYSWDSTSKSVIQSAILFFNANPPFGRLSLKFSVWRSYRILRCLSTKSLPLVCGERIVLHTRPPGDSFINQFLLSTP